MPAILPKLSVDRDSMVSRFFTPYQLLWIFAEDHLHAQNKQAIILAEKSVRIGWTYADAYKNVRKRLLFKNRDYLFATKDYPSALEYMRQCKIFVQAFDNLHSIISHGEDRLKVNRLDPAGKSSALTEEIKIGYIKFDNGSRIIAFSAHPQAMAVYGGDVGLDEFAKHPNAELLWQTAQGRVTWGYDMVLSRRRRHPLPPIRPTSPSSLRSPSPNRIGRGIKGEGIRFVLLLLACRAEASQRRRVLVLGCSVIGFSIKSIS